MNLDLDTIDALGCGGRWEEQAWGALLVEARRRDREAEAERLRVRRATDADYRDRVRAQKREQARKARRAAGIAYEGLYGGKDSGETTVAQAVAEWCLAHSELRIALCGHRGDYDLPGWSVMEWSRGRLTYGGASTTHEEAVWFSPACINTERGQGDLFAARAGT